MTHMLYRYIDECMAYMHIKGGYHKGIVVDRSTLNITQETRPPYLYTSTQTYHEQCENRRIGDNSREDIIPCALSREQDHIETPVY